MLDRESTKTSLGSVSGGAYREIVGAGLVSSELPTEVCEGAEAVGAVEGLWAPLCLHSTLLLCLGG